MSRVGEWNMLLSEMKDVTLQSYSFTTGPEGIQQ